MKDTRLSLVAFCSLVVASCVSAGSAQEKMAADGFEITITEKTELDANAACDALVNDFSKWWDMQHSYSLDAANLSMDLEKRCLFEDLGDGGFVRHMEIVFYQPGKVLRLTGGLGPLQQMGVCGALQFQFEPDDDGTNMKLTYNVSGSSIQTLDKVAPAVRQVLADQLARLKTYCDDKANRQ